MEPSCESLAAGTYLALTTFRSDGTPVTTPVWVVGEASRLLVTTQAQSGKVRRIRAHDRVLVASCDARGRLKSAQVPAVAQIQDEVETRRITELIRRRYGFLGWLLTRRGRAEDRVALSISLLPS